MTTVINLLNLNLYGFNPENISVNQIKPNSQFDGRESNAPHGNDIIDITQYGETLVDNEDTAMLETKKIANLKNPSSNAINYDNSGKTHQNLHENGLFIDIYA